MVMNKKSVYILAIITMVVAVIVEVLFAHPHYHKFWHTMPGFDMLFGFLGCAVLIFVAKKIVAPLIQRDEDYYDGGDDDHE